MTTPLVGNNRSNGHTHNNAVQAMPAIAMWVMARMVLTRVGTMGTEFGSNVVVEGAKLEIPGIKFNTEHHPTSGQVACGGFGQSTPSLEVAQGSFCIMCWPAEAGTTKLQRPQHTVPSACSCFGQVP